MMFDKKSYWKLSDHPFCFPSLQSAKQELKAAVDYESDKLIYDGTTIDHVVNGVPVTRVFASVSPQGKIQFSRPQRI